MAPVNKDIHYVPGMYANRRSTGAQLAENYFRELDRKLVEATRKKQEIEAFPTICISRKIGVGAVEIADIIAKTLSYQVVDREILEHLASEANISQKTVAAFDERYPGRMNEFFKMLFGEKSFVKSDYTRHLFGTVYSIAGLSPTLFVGRGTHLILPRENVFAVRFICSDRFRIERLTGILGADPASVKKKLVMIDKEQAAFFSRVYGKKNAEPYEFDMVINCDCIPNPVSIAEIVSHAFRKKFPAKPAD